MADTLQDFIPDGEESGSPYQGGVFQDFVPASEPTPQQVSQEVTSEETAQPVVAVQPEPEVIAESPVSETPIEVETVVTPNIPEAPVETPVVAEASQWDAQQQVTQDEGFVDTETVEGEKNDSTT